VDSANEKREDSKIRLEERSPEPSLSYVVCPIMSQKPYVPLEVLFDGDTRSLHGVELGNLSRIGDGERRVRRNEPVEDGREDANDFASLGFLLFRRSFHPSSSLRRNNIYIIVLLDGCSKEKAIESESKWYNSAGRKRCCRWFDFVVRFNSRRDFLQLKNVKNDDE